MSGFTALNVEPEDQLEEEVDDTKEIQLEEAFKLYQNALKLQSQGLGSYKEASEAYQQLFRSEVFQYPEAISEYAHDQLEDYPEASTNQNDLQAIAVSASGSDTSANSLLQLLYLAHKNHGEFILNDTHAGAGSNAAVGRRWKEASDQTLHQFASALESDDTDIDLWKKAARVAEVLASQRIVRFCLESALAGDDDVEDSIDISGLDEAYSIDKLNAVILSLCDDLSTKKIQHVKPRQALRHLLRKRNDPYPFLPARHSALEYTDDGARPINFRPVRHTMRPAKCTWTSLAQAILQALAGEQSNTLDFGPGGAILVELPDSVISHPTADDPGPASEVRSGFDETTILKQNSKSADVTVDLTRDTQQPLVEANPEGVDGRPTATEPAAMPEGPDGSRIQTTGLEAVSDIEEPKGAEDQPTTISLPSRKRSATTAGNEDAGAGTRSKRLRARESMADGVTAELDAYSQQGIVETEVCDSADTCLFGFVNKLHQNIGVPVTTTFEDIKQTFDEGNRNEPFALHSGDVQNSKSSLLLDLKHALLTWSDEKGRALSSGHGNPDVSGGKAGLTPFLQHFSKSSNLASDDHFPETDSSLFALMEQINTQWSSIHDIAILFLQSLLCTDDTGESAYMKAKWSDDLKQSVVQIVVREDEQLYSALHNSFWKMSLTGNNYRNPATASRGTLELVEGLFELHLDIYCSVTNPSSQVDLATRTQQQDRLVRWAELASLMIDTSTSHYTSSDTLLLRYVFAAATYGSKAEEDRHEYVSACLHDLTLFLKSAGSPTILLPNNVAMSEISVRAVDQETSRLSTLDFFRSIFENDDSDAVGIIESLEPILCLSIPGNLNRQTQDGLITATQSEKLLAFLESGDASLKLFLWQRLQNAYQTISYMPMVVSCQLRAIEAIMIDLESTRHADLAPAQRQISLLKSLKTVDDLVARVVSRAVSHTDAFECLDAAHLCSSIDVSARFAKLLHGFVLFEDSVRMNKLAMRPVLHHKSFEKSKERIREMLVRVWTLQYLLLEEATVQFPQLFQDPTQELVDFLVFLHSVIGERRYCKYANKVLIKQMMKLAVHGAPWKDYQTELAQIGFDMYGLRTAVGVGDDDHGCQPEDMDKPVAMRLVPMFMAQANRLSIKDFAKNDLRSNIDKAQKAIGPPEYLPGSTEHHNRKLIRTYLQSPVDAKELYQCVKGVGNVPIRAVRSEYSVLADQGWYFLQGHLALTKFKSIKRVNPTGTDELDVASTFLLQDLELGPGEWETWYRLAQVFEAKIEDDLIWSSTKLNDNRSDIATLERKSIHAFCMAIAIAMRSADINNLETAQKLNELFTELASRLYASSREPLDMEAFKTDKSIRHYSRESDQFMYKGPSIRPMTVYSVWNFAAGLLRRNFTDSPKHWTSYYVLTKCLWKMLCYEVDRDDASFDRKKAMGIVLAAATTAIEAVPPKSEKALDYILEPHFKLVSLVHKMVCRSLLSPEEAVTYLEVTPHASMVELSYNESGEVIWKTYILAVLGRLKKADKSNWHHRIVGRSARIIFDGQDDYAGAMGARQEFTHQVFTKTMTLQVWKPEFERPGRHYVYTGRYVQFFVKLLDMLDDKGNLDQLLRRIRRKPNDFLNHALIWEETVVTYVRVLRRIGKVPEGHEKIVFHDALLHEEFEARSQRLEAWAQEAHPEDVVLEVLRDAMELKKLNINLMKGTMVDDLAQDAYAKLYEERVNSFGEDEKQDIKADITKAPPSMQTLPEPVGGFVVKSALKDGTSLPDGRMSVGNLLLNTNLDTQLDGPVDVRPLGLGLQHTPFETTHTATTGPYNNTNIARCETSSAQQQRSLSSVGISSVPKPGGRVKNITKAELKRKIEALLVKPPPIKTPVLSKKPILEIEVDEPTPSRDRGERAVKGVDTASDKELAIAHRKWDEPPNDSSRGQSSESNDENYARDVDMAEGDGDADNEGGESEDNGNELSDVGEVNGEGDEGNEDEDEDVQETTNGPADQENPTPLQQKSQSVFPGLMSKMGGLFSGFGRRQAAGSIEAGAEHVVSNLPFSEEGDNYEVEIEDSQDKVEHSAGPL